jgi:hypothetical protein
LEIKEKKGFLNYKFKFLEEIRFYLIFYIILFEPADPKTLLQITITGINPEFEIPSYNVEKILDIEIINNKLYYLIKWKGFAYTENI